MSSGRPTPHQVPRPLGRHVRNEPFEHCEALLLGLSHRQPADREPGPRQAQQCLQRGEPQRQVHTALDDTEQAPRGRLPIGAVVMSVAAHRPAHRALHRGARFGLGGGIGRAVIERHRDVRAQRELHVHRVFRIELHLAAVDRRAKAHALLADPPQAAQAEHLESAGVGEQCLPPVHEAVQPAVSADDRGAGPQQQVQGVAEDDLGAESLELLGGHGFHRAVGPHRHESRCLDRPVCGREAPDPCRAIACTHGERRVQARPRETSIASP